MEVSGVTYILVFMSVIAMTGAQLFLKKGLIQVGGFPDSLSRIGDFFLSAYTNVHVLLAVLLTAVTALAWTLAVSKAELSRAYPFMALSYVLVALFSLLIFKEDVGLLRWTGIAVICLGVLLISRS
jgi:drug/metabolite transporter (DMT)-like permease